MIMMVETAGEYRMHLSDASIQRDTQLTCGFTSVALPVARVQAAG